MSADLLPFAGFDHFAILDESDVSQRGQVGLKCDPALAGDFVPHDNGTLPTLGCETESPGGCLKIIADEGMPGTKGIADQSSVYACFSA